MSVVVVAATLVVIAVIALPSVRQRLHSASDGAGSMYAAAEFAYDVRGTYHGRVVKQIPVSERGFYAAEYEVTFSVGENYCIEQITWTHEHFLIKHSKVTCTYPATFEYLGQIRRSYRERFSPWLNEDYTLIRRKGNNLTIRSSYPGSPVPEFELDWDAVQLDAAPVLEGNGELVLSDDGKSLVARVRACIPALGLVEIPAESIRFRLARSTAVEQIPGSYENNIMQIVRARNIDCSDIRLSRYPSGLLISAEYVNMEFNDARVDIEATADSRFQLTFARALSLEAEIIFHDDGSKQVRIPDRETEFEVERVDPASQAWAS
ncbi:MAG: hypothetical protein KAY24_03980 [Candidatus Eisenbacteria sp.]|nr:hypothetical protein [Candidatus Eisenbacteria bacterium]